MLRKQGVFCQRWFDVGPAPQMGSLLSEVYISWLHASGFNGILCLWLNVINVPMKYGNTPYTINFKGMRFAPYPGFAVVSYFYYLTVWLCIIFMYIHVYINMYLFDSSTIFYNHNWYILCFLWPVRYHDIVVLINWIMSPLCTHNRGRDILLYLCPLSLSQSVRVSLPPIHFSPALYICKRSNMRRWPNAGLMLAHHLRHWPNISPVLGYCAVFGATLNVGQRHRWWASINPALVQSIVLVSPAWSTD